MAGDLARSVVEIVARKNRDGTWGGPDSLDQLISTTHVAMTLMAAGFQPNSASLRPALDFLAELDTRRITTFFWRSGPLLNVSEFSDIVRHDIDYLFQLRERAGGSPHYPAMFFLLKLLRFQSGEIDKEKINATVDWIVSEWREENCWYGSTSLTSMGLALLVDMENIPKKIILRSEEFLIENFKTQKGDRLGFSDNLIDDAFTVYNLYERMDLIATSLPAEIYEKADLCIDDILNRSEQNLWLDVEPPFGGAVDSPEYASSIVVRAALARELSRNKDFEIELVSSIADESFIRSEQAGDIHSGIVPFWGELNIRNDAFCFVVMPFEEKRTNIYLKYVKEPIEQELGVECKRSDNITRSLKIMENIWDLLQSSSVVIADISEKNPNVFYELGFAHAIGKPVVMIVESLEDVPFDVGSIRAIEYGDSKDTWKQLSERIVEFVKTELKQI